MSSKRQVSKSSSGKRKPPKSPKPSLPDEDPKLTYVLSTSAGAAAKIAALADSAEKVSDASANAVGDVASGNLLEGSTKLTSESRKSDKRKVTGYLVGFFLVLTALTAVLYFILQSFFR